LLLEPTLPLDPKLRKFVQKPAPPFIVKSDLKRAGLVEPGDRIELPVLFLGSGIMSIEPFAKLLQQVGKQGLLNGQGTCELTAIETVDACGHRSAIWNGGELSGVIPVISDLRWWLEGQSSDWNRLHLDFVSPLRLMKDGKPLFKVGFQKIFPFILRRVTAMLATHCNIETVKDPSVLLSAAQKVEELGNSLHWRDWRPLSAERGGQDLGGLCGTLELAGNELADMLWVLQLGSLFQIGKGAPYGAGCYRLFS